MERSESETASVGGLDLIDSSCVQNFDYVALGHLHGAQRAGAEHIHGDYVISRKPNPAYLAAASFDPELVRRELQETCRAAKENGCTCELILKDVSTVQYHPERLAQWHKIAVEVAGEW